MPDAYNGDVRLAYERRGPADAETLVFVEGLGYGRWMWHWQADALTGYHRVLWDNRGTGDSATPEGPYTVEAMAADLGAVLDAAGVQSAHVVGASMGGMIAQQFALSDDRVASLTLLCTSPGGPDAVPTPEATQARMYDVPEGFDERERRRYKMEPAMSDDFWRENDETIERIVDWRIESDASEQAIAWQSAAVAGFDVSDRLDEIRVPALVVHGSDDRVVPVENGRLLADGLPDAEYHELDGAPHLLFAERADTVNDYISDFLDDVRVR